MKFKRVLALLLSISVNQVVLATEILKLSTTTSTENSGLLTELHAVFEAQTGIKVEVIAVGTGKALKIGSMGDVDVVLVHAPKAEMDYVNDGFFIDRTAVMYNDFVVVGPVLDPAKLSESSTVVQSFKKIAGKSALFISRGDDSGTHKKELSIWQGAGMVPRGEWYLSVGQGMGAVLIMADNKQAYALTDRGTQIAFADKLSLSVLFQGDPALFNPYHVMAVNPEKHPHVQYALAQQYIDFLVSELGQTSIAKYKKSGQQLFYPDAIKY